MDRGRKQKLGQEKERERKIGQDMECQMEGNTGYNKDGYRKEIQDRTRTSRGRKYRIGQGRTEEGNTGQNKDGQRKEMQDRTRTDRGRKYRIEQGRVEEGNTGQDKKWEKDQMLKISGGEGVRGGELEV